jgi:tetratricopeptide (TPR) repeat protein
LSGCFFVLTLGAYLGYVRHGRTASRYMLVALMLSLGLMSKAMLVTVPALLLLLDYWPLGRFGQAADLPRNRVVLPRQSFWRLAVEKLPLAALALGDGLMTLATHSETPDRALHPWSERISNAVVSLATSLFQFFYPIDLAVFYPLPAGGQPAWKVVGASALIAAISTAAVLARGRRPYLPVGWFWFVGMVIPVLGLINVAEHRMADRCLYLPSIGLSIAVAWGAARLGADRREKRLLLAAGAALVIGALVSQAVRQTSYWHDDLGLWEHALETTGPNAEAEHALGFALAKADRLDEAVEHYVRAARWRVDADLLTSLAAVLMRQGKLDEAAALLHHALEINPSCAKAEDNLGSVLEQQGDREKAAEEYRRAIELDPFFAPSRLKLADLLLNDGEFDQAIVHFERAIALEPTDPAAYTGLAVALSQRGQIDEAIAHCRHALELSPDDENARRVLDKLFHPDAPVPPR